MFTRTNTTLPLILLDIFVDMIQVRPYHLLLSPSPNSELKQQHCNILLEGKNPFDENILIIFLPASFCTVLWPVSFYSAGPEVQEYFTAYLRVALYALSKVISFSTSSPFIFFVPENFIAFSGNENADLLSNELQFMHTPRWLRRRYNQTRQIGPKYVFENCMPWIVQPAREARGPEGPAR